MIKQMFVFEIDSKMKKIKVLYLCILKEDFCKLFILKFLG